MAPAGTMMPPSESDAGRRRLRIEPTGIMVNTILPIIACMLPAASAPKPADVFKRFPRFLPGLQDDIAVAGADDVLFVLPFNKKLLALCQRAGIQAAVVDRKLHICIDARELRQAQGCCPGPA